MFEALFKGVSTRFGLRTIEKSVENPDFIFCSSFQNLRLGSIKVCSAIPNDWAKSSKSNMAWIMSGEESEWTHLGNVAHG